MIECYIDEWDPTNPFGKAKEATLRAVAASCLGGRLEQGLTSRALVDYALWRISSEGGAFSRKPSITTCRTLARCYR